MKVMGRLILLAAVIAGGVWLWTVFFPSPEKIIRHRLAEVAQAASFKAGEPPLMAIGKARKLSGFFNTNVAVSLTEPEHFEQTFANRDEIARAAAGARSEFNGLTIKFLDVNVTVGADKQSATADLTVQVQSPGQKDFAAQEIKVSFQKIGGEWLITRVETVRTLS